MSFACNNPEEENDALNDETFGGLDEGSSLEPLDSQWELTHEKMAAIHQEFLRGASTPDEGLFGTAIPLKSADPKAVSAAMSSGWGVADMETTDSMSRLMLDAGLDFNLVAPKKPAVSSVSSSSSTTTKLGSFSPSSAAYGGAAVWGESIWTTPGSMSSAFASKPQPKPLSVAELEQQQQQQQQQQVAFLHAPSRPVAPMSLEELERQILDSSSNDSSMIPPPGMTQYAMPPPGIPRPGAWAYGSQPPGAPLVQSSHQAVNVNSDSVPSFSSSSFPPLSSASPIASSIQQSETVVKPPVNTLVEGSSDENFASDQQQQQQQQQHRQHNKYYKNNENNRLQRQYNNNSSNNNSNNNYYNNRYNYNNNNNNNNQNRPPRQSKPFQFTYMSRTDREFVTRVQLSQLQTENPFVDDFYYQTYTLRKFRDDAMAKRLITPQPKPPPHHHSKELQASQKSDSSQKTDQQDKDKNVQQKHPIFENVLGKIMTGSVHNPRKMISVQTVDTEKDPSAEDKDISRRRKNLRLIEGAYQQLLNIEDVDRKAQTIPISERQSVFQARSVLIDQLFSTLQLNVVGIDGEVDDSGFLDFISVPKGLKSIRRALNLFTQNQTLAAVLAILRHTENLAFGRVGQFQSDATESLNLLMSHVVPPLCRAVELFPLDLVEKSMAVFLTSCSSSDAFANVISSGFGVTILYAFLRRIDYLLPDAMKKKEVSNWPSLSALLLNNLNGKFASTVKACVESGSIWVYAMLSVLAKNISGEQRKQLKAELGDVLKEIPEKVSQTAAVKSLLQHLA